MEVVPLVPDDKMNREDQNETTAAPKPPRWKDWMRKASMAGVRLVIAGVLLGYLYAWASPLVYPKDRPLGFAHGFAHGGLMPMALSSLVIGKDVEIFAHNNNGRFYKLGYICGINVCGLLFFGFGFGMPKREKT